MKRTAVLFVAAAAIAASIPVLRPAAERAWFVYTVGTDAAPLHLPPPVDAAGGIHRGGARNPYPRLEPQASASVVISADSLPLARSPEP